MSFSSSIKSELCKLENKKTCCLRAECYGMWLFSKCFSLRETAYVTENSGVARRMLELAAAAAGAGGELSYGVSRRKKPAYRVALQDEDSRLRLLSAFGHTGGETSLRINRAVLEDDCCQAAFLRGAFLTCGTAADPQKGYHLEFAVPYQKLANQLYTLLSEVTAFPVNPLLASRKGSYVVYWKESGQIEDLLTFLGAAGASMELMQVRMYKEAKNDINRKANFETANMDKTYSASARQIAAIAVLNDVGELSNLPDGLRELARLRLENPEMTLRQLGEALGISRSGVNHRLERLLELGEKYLETGKKIM
ncbi:DNA-binding protein WhiA [Neglectibacter caecimuris]|uniref:DNA-binding protein WhiA n=1 Tax=Neglectibacter caecimuris TaxID=3093658 RepID=UPI002AC9655B|nr:DNA-binding protein WhiA [Neglectibacter sp. M00184]